MTAEIQTKLNQITQLHHELESLISKIGVGALTADRIIELFAHHLLEEDLRYGGVRICAGYGSSHVWIADAIIDRPVELASRCPDHQDRRSKVQRS